MKQDENLPELMNDEITRYSRHIILPNVGINGQKQLKKSKVLIVGAGALASPIALYLSGAGVGTIGIVDFDRVEVTNLQRQIMHSLKNVGKLKTESAKEAILNINPNVNVITFNVRLDSGNALNIIKDFDIVADCTDNFPTRYLVNDACVLLNKPLVYGAVFRFSGQVSFFWKEKGACYRCIIPEPPPRNLVTNCGEGGIFGVLPGTIGSLQANEIIKFLLGSEELLINRLLLFDAWKMRFSEIKLEKDKNCPICSSNASIKELTDYEFFCGIKHGKADILQSINAKELKEKIDNGEKINIVDVREPYEFEIVQLQNSLNIPLGNIAKCKSEIDSNFDTVILCKSGVRSIHAIKMLQESGFHGRLLNLEGGILSWVENVDKSLATY